MYLRVLCVIFLLDTPCYEYIHDIISRDIYGSFG